MVQEMKSQGRPVDSRVLATNQGFGGDCGNLMSRVESHPTFSLGYGQWQGQMPFSARGGSVRCQREMDQLQLNGRHAATGSKEKVGGCAGKEELID